VRHAIERFASQRKVGACLAPARQRALRSRIAARDKVPGISLPNRVRKADKRRTASMEQTGGSGSGTAATSQGGGGTPGGTTVVVNSTDSKAGKKADAVQGIVDRLTQRYGTVERALEVLAGENYEYRDQLRTQGEELAALRTKVPADGALVLTADQKKTWDAIVATNVPLDKVAERIKRAGELEAEQAKAAFDKLVETGASSVKFNAEVLKGLLTDKGYTLELRDTIVDGKTSKIPFIRKANDQNAAWEQLTVAAEKDFKAYLPALKTLPQGGTGGAGSGGTGGGSESVAHDFPNQSSASSSQGGGESGNVVDQFIERSKKRADRPNPLRPAATKS
jgi:hypothetical protein